MLILILSLALAAAAAAQQGGSALERAYDEVVAAQTALEQALRAREAGVEPRPGERIGIVGGASRLAEQYWERQKRLDEEIELARKRRDEALEQWNALR